ncbi:MAG TPA: sigma 54-interacting transcriptional regulator [Vicinamibacteria bacterium]|nr:sigma 54-interacting transcriptional regulator [Vicinamibacteria bacterium]
MRIIAVSESMREVLELVETFAPFGEVTVLIGGESGTGKELVARALHRGSPRARRAFCALNAAALPDGLLEAELFGHARGAFTGAQQGRRGLFEEADGGTLFLDEVGELSARAQTILLRVLQEREYRRLGETVLRRSDFRLVAATHKDLDVEVAAGRFRQDLLFRLKVARIQIPPLRERPDDIVPLAREAVACGARRFGLPVPSLSREAEERLRHCPWPGNVRELENEVMQALLRTAGARTIELRHLSRHLGEASSRSLRSESADFEKHFLEETLARTGGNRTRAARALGLSRQSLYRKMRRHGLLAASQ